MAKRDMRLLSKKYELSTLDLNDVDTIYDVICKNKINLLVATGSYLPTNTVLSMMKSRCFPMYPATFLYPVRTAICLSGATAR